MKRTIFEYTFRSQENEEKLLHPIRRTILNKLQLLSVTIGIIPLIAGLVVSVETGTWIVFIGDALAYALIVVFFLLRHKSFRISALGSVLTLTFIGLLLLITVGMYGASLMWLFTPVALASLMLKPQTGTSIFFVIIAALITVGILLTKNLLPWHVTPGIWIIIAVSFITITSFLMIAIRFIIHRLAASIQLERKMNRKLRAAVAEQDELLREIHHRVKNNLQLIISMLRLESVHAESEKELISMRTSEQRVSALALVYAHIDRSAGSIQVRFSELLKQVIGQCVLPPGHSGYLEVNHSIDQISLPLDQSISMSIFVTEAIALLLESGPKQLNAVFRTVGNGCFFKVSTEDHGNRIGGRQEFKKELRGETRLQIIESLSEQMGGELSINTENTMSIEYTLPG